jgi:hypothetical protein
MGDEKERLLSEEESRQNYGSFITSEFGKRLYRNTAAERWVKVSCYITYCYCSSLFICGLFNDTKVARNM